MPTWPASLPQSPLAAGLSVQDDDAVLRTPMDTGPATRRNRYTAIKQTTECRMVLKGEQKQTFDIFYRAELANGALSFDWVEPVTGRTTTCAFKSRPRFSLLTPGTTSNNYWSVSFELEMTPVTLGLLAEDGSPLLDEDGSYLLEE